MRCPCPISIQDPRKKGAANRVVVPCGVCPVCLQNRRHDWSFRLGEELRTAKNAYFITLTYSDENLLYNIQDRLPTLHKKHVQAFTKKLRTYITRLDKNYPQYRFYATGEYGTQTLRPHYHIIGFNIPPKIAAQIEKIWNKGTTFTVNANDATIHYTTKYIINSKKAYGNREQPKALMSRRPPIGHNYLLRNEAYHQQTLNPYVIKNGYIARMPSYYKDKIFSEDQKEFIAKKYQELGDTKYLQDWDKNKGYDGAFEIEQIEYIFNQINLKSQSK